MNINETIAQRDAARLCVEALLAETEKLRKERENDIRRTVAAEALVSALKNRFDLETHIERQRAFSLETFGPGTRADRQDFRDRKHKAEREARQRL